MKYIYVTLFISILYSCNTISDRTLDTLKMREFSTHELKPTESREINLKKGDILEFWVDLDVEYSGELYMEHTIQVEKDGKKLGGFKMTTLEPLSKTRSIKTQYEGKYKQKFYGYLNFFEIHETGKYKFIAVMNRNDTSPIELGKADINIVKR